MIGSPVQTDEREGAMERESSGSVVALVTDLFFSVRLSNEIRRAGFVPLIVKSISEFKEAIAGAYVGLAVIDLGVRINGDDLRSLSQAAQRAGIPLIGFGPHKDVETFREAQAAGLTRVMSNSQFHANTVETIQRYARTAMDGEVG
jgi:DNA-binding NtrC family response regulator